MCNLKSVVYVKSKKMSVYVPERGKREWEKERKNEKVIKQIMTNQAM